MAALDSNKKQSGGSDALTHGQDEHPAGPVRHGPLMQAFLMVAFFFYMNISCLA